MWMLPRIPSLSSHDKPIKWCLPTVGVGTPCWFSDYFRVLCPSLRSWSDGWCNWWGCMKWPTGCSTLMIAILSPSPQIIDHAHALTCYSSCIAILFNSPVFLSRNWVSEQLSGIDMNLQRGGTHLTLKFHNLALAKKGDGLIGHWWLTCSIWNIQWWGWGCAISAH